MILTKSLSAFLKLSSAAGAVLAILAVVGCTDPLGGVQESRDAADVSQTTILSLGGSLALHESSGRYTTMNISFQIVSGEAQVNDVEIDEIRFNNQLKIGRFRFSPANSQLPLNTGERTTMYVQSSYDGGRGSCPMEIESVPLSAVIKIDGVLHNVVGEGLLSCAFDD